MTSPIAVTIDDVRTAARTLTGQVARTPTVAAPSLSRLAGCDVALKLESLQVTGSFKPRGAFVRLSAMTPSERKAGVVAASAGNHAQGVAYHAKRLGIPATIFMPAHTPFNKIARTEALGAKVVLTGDGLAEAAAAARAETDKSGAVFVSPYDDPRIVAGQGTVGLEFLEDAPDLEALIVPIGGGGLIAGIAVAAKAVKPEIDVFGVEVALYPSMSCALRGEAPSGGGITLAEGIAVKVPGKITLPVVRDLVEEIFLVDEPAIEAAVNTLIEDERLVVEGAGAAPLAALLAHKDRFRGRRIGLVVSGGNIDARLLASVLMRGLVREGRMARLRIAISDAPGVLARVAGIIGAIGGNIVEVYHQRLFYDVPVKQADLDVVVETQNPRHVDEIIKKLGDAGYPARRLGDLSVGD